MADRDCLSSDAISFTSTSRVRCLKGAIRASWTPPVLSKLGRGHEYYHRGGCCRIVKLIKDSVSTMAIHSKACVMSSEITVSSQNYPLLHILLPVRSCCCLYPRPVRMSDIEACFENGKLSPNHNQRLADPAVSPSHVCCIWTLMVL